MSGTVAALRFLAPFLLTLLAYELQKVYLPWLRGEIHVSDLYELERLIFGIESNGRLITPNEWFALHIHPTLDLFAGLAYLLFIPQFLAAAAYFRFILPKLRAPEQRRGIRANAERMAWAFFIVNLMGYVTYIIYPAAPPWYIAQHGFAAPDLSLPASPAGAARFDALFGISVFHEMYSQSTNVFGAVPSLHVSYPLIATIFAFRLRSLRAFCLGFYFLISFAAVYLNHHYLLDVAVGSAFGAVAGLALARKQNAGA